MIRRPPRSTQGVSSAASDVYKRQLKLQQNKILDEEKNISALSWYWTFLLVVWLGFFLMIYVFNDTFIDWCKSLVA